MASEEKIAIVVPAYNAASHIDSVLDRIPEETWPDITTVWIINDGSTDTTGSIIKELADRNNKITTLHLPVNKGYGTAVQIGLKKCRESSCRFAVCLHADGQYPPESIPPFIDRMESTNCDILQGSRIASGTALRGGMPLYKYIGGKILTFFENRVFGLSMTDYHSGFLFYSRRALDTIPFSRLSRSFDFDVEVIASACATGLSVREMPIPARYADERSYLNPVIYGLRVVGVMVKYLLGMYRSTA
jgi:glycosyltransferase involved in cell wall biosynthesis